MVELTVELALKLLEFDDVLLLCRLDALQSRKLVVCLRRELRLDVLYKRV